ncbi:MAG: glycosyltransferase [Bacteroidetes bacterium]|jgi:glycosyltransferase involved in cell wall biosynthesis|nr:glycosyltransferase [Bacteroidota bacterium]
MKHITIISTSFPDASLKKGQEAAGTFVYDFVYELSQHAKVTIIAPGSQSKSQEIDKLKIQYFSVPSLPLSLLKPTNPTHWFNIIKTLKAGQNMVNKIVVQEKPDHIFALWALPSGYWAKKAGEKYNTPYSSWALGSDIWSLGKIPIVRSVLKSVLRGCKHRFADGYILANNVAKISERDCTFLPSSRKLPVRTVKKLATHPPYKLAFLGRWHSHKGVDLLLESLTYLEKEDWVKISEIQICGGGPLEELVHEEVEKLQNKGLPLTLRGYLNREEATELLLWADYLLLPSRIESIPVIFSDAMQANCPLISTPIGDLPRLLAEEKVGLLAGKITSQAYAGAIKKALKQKPINYDAGLANMRQNFSVEVAVRQFLAL